MGKPKNENASKDTASWYTAEIREICERVRASVESTADLVLTAFVAMLPAIRESYAATAKKRTILRMLEYAFTNGGSVELSNTLRTYFTPLAWYVSEKQKFSLSSMSNLRSRYEKDREAKRKKAVEPDKSAVAEDGVTERTAQRDPGLPVGKPENNDWLAQARELVSRKTVEACALLKEAGVPVMEIEESFVAPIAQIIETRAKEYLENKKIQANLKGNGKR